MALLKERDKPESVEMGLNWGEGLVRAKREFGTELGEFIVMDEGQCLLIRFCS